jgi:hypothetical protein
MPLRTKLDHVHHVVRAVTKLCPLVVIAEDETDLSVEAGEVSQRVRAPEGEVPEMPHHIAPPDPSILDVSRTSDVSNVTEAFLRDEV